jgi:hypothetical protein
MQSLCPKAHQKKNAKSAGWAAAGLNRKALGLRFLSVVRVLKTATSASPLKHSPETPPVVRILPATDFLRPWSESRLLRKKKKEEIVRLPWRGQCGRAAAARALWRACCAAGYAKDCTGSPVFF